MQELHLFEYAVIRIVPRVEREEFVNAGVILYCAGQRFLSAKINLPEQKILQLSPETDMEAIRKNLEAILRIARAEPDAGPIAKLEMPERFRWLTATRSTIIQSSKVHPGLCVSPQKTLEKLFTDLVL